MRILLLLLSDVIFIQNAEKLKLLNNLIHAIYWSHVMCDTHKTLESEYLLIR